MGFKEWLIRIKEFVCLITVEPTLVFYMLAFMTTSIVEQAFYVDKACRVNHKFNDSICDNIAKNESSEYKRVVQLTVSEFHQWNDIAGHGGQIILALFMGAWSDKRGRKFPLLIGLFGKFYFSSMIVVNALQPTWPVEYIIYTATLPMTITGADVAIFAAAYSYLSDITKPESRTLRVTLMEVSYLATMPTGIALGSFLFNLTDHSYAIMFIINASLLAISIIYTLLRLEWRTNEKQKPLSEAKNVFTDFFDYKYVVETSKTIFKKRRFNHRAYLLLLILAMACYTFQRDERAMSYLYFQYTVHWDVSEVSNFRTYQSAIQVIVLLCAVPFMSKLMGWKDTVIAMFGAIFHCIARIFYSVTTTKWLIYFGGAFASLGPVVAPIIRSIVSKLVPVVERGKVFSILSAADNAVPIFSGTIYNQVYRRTLDTHPPAIFYVTIASQIIVLFIFIFIHIKSRNSTLEYQEDETAQVCLNEEQKPPAYSE